MTAALNIFIFWLADRCRLFFQLLYKWRDFEWIEECSVAFEELKQYLSQPPILSMPKKEQVLYAYIVVIDHAMSLVLVRTDFGVQKSVYYISKSLQEAENWYFPLKNFGYHTCHEEASPLLPGPHRRDPHPASPTSIAMEIRLYRENSQMMNNVRSI